ncbi:MAG: hypothetical protein ACU0BK_13815 [Shimia sp.]|uniref:hypothetical protein n=1 Tax=Shimia sp. TaxID=1954381 RepID=UPI004057F2DE
MQSITHWVKFLYFTSISNIIATNQIGGVVMSKSGSQKKTANFELSAWFNEDTGHIHLAMPKTDWSVTTVTNDPNSIRCHENLYKKLARALKESGVSAPAL